MKHSALNVPTKCHMIWPLSPGAEAESELRNIKWIEGGEQCGELSKKQDTAVNQRSPMGGKDCSTCCLHVSPSHTCAHPPACTYSICPAPLQKQECWWGICPRVHCHTTSLSKCTPSQWILTLTELTHALQDTPPSIHPHTHWLFWFSVAETILQIWTLLSRLSPNEVTLA